MGKFLGKLFYNIYKNASPEKQKKMETSITDAKKKLSEYSRNSDTERAEVKLYDVYICCTSLDKNAADVFKAALKEKGISVFDDFEVKVGTNYNEQVTKAISEAKIFVPIVGEYSLKSTEFEVKLTYAERRGKRICPVLLSDKISDVGTGEISRILMQYQITKAPTAEDIKKAAYEIAEFLGKSNEKNTLFDKFSEYKKAGLKDKAAEVLFEIIRLHCDKIKNENVSDADAKLLLSYTEELANICWFEDSDEGVNLAMQASGAMGTIVNVVRADRLMKNLLQISVAMRIMSIVREIDRVTLDIITGGMVSNDRFDMSIPMNDYKNIQEHYAEKYYALKSAAIVEYKLEDIEFIEKSAGYYFGNINVIKGKEKTEKKEENLFEAVARFMNEGNKVLDIIGKEKPAKDFIKCLITSYERLKAYSEIVGAKEVLGECIEKIAELKQLLSKATDQEETDQIAENGIKSLLGLSIPNTGEFDVFISHKHEDFDLALDMYEFLKTNLKEGFFDKYSLPEMSDSEYRDAIMQALDGSKHFVVVFSSLDYLKSEWVKLEMKIFRSEIDEGRKDGNFIMVVTSDVYDEIMKSKKSVLPIEYRRCEIIKVEDYKKVLLSYIN